MKNRNVRNLGMLVTALALSIACIHTTTASNILAGYDNGIIRVDGVVGIFAIDTVKDVTAGDVNNDGSVNNLDITPFITALSVDGDEETFLSQVTNGSFLAADIDKSGAPNNLDITQFIKKLG